MKRRWDRNQEARIVNWATKPRQPEEMPPQGSLWRRTEKPAELVWGDPAADDELPLLPETFAPPSWDDAIGTAWKNFVRRVRRAGRRGTTAAVVLLALLLLAVAWGSRPSPGWPGVTRFESVLVKLGLAEVPAANSLAPEGKSRPAGMGGRAYCALLLPGVRSLRQHSRGPVRDPTRRADWISFDPPPAPSANKNAHPSA